MEYIYIPAKDIDNYQDPIANRENEQEEESKCQVEEGGYINNKIMDMEQLFSYFGRVFQFNLFNLSKLCSQGQSCMSDKKLKSSNISLFRDAFVERMKQEISQMQHRTEESIFKFIIQRSSDNPILHTIGLSLFQNHLGEEDEMKSLFQEVFGNGEGEREEIPNFFDCELTGKIFIAENTDSKLKLKCEFHNFRERLYLKDCMLLSKSLIILSFIIDIVMFVLFSQSGKTLEYEYQLNLYCEENLSYITKLKGLINHAQKCSYDIRILDDSTIGKN